MPTSHNIEGVSHFEDAHYNGKNYVMPIFETDDPLILQPQHTPANLLPNSDHPILKDINTVFNIERFLEPRTPISLGVLDDRELDEFTEFTGLRVLDMPIKFPEVSEYRIPRALKQYGRAIQRIIDFEQMINPEIDDYFAYLSIDQGIVQPESLQREAPCHVDGFQGARWQPKVRINHTYTVSDILPTAYYVQPFDLRDLDETRHDFFWEMNAQVADTKEAFKWQPDDAEITLMDVYCVHRGVEAQKRAPRTWLRLSFEERSRVFDRLGNAHNPLFDYDWEMVERDIEQLQLQPYRTDVDPSLNVFPWQALDGSPLPAGSSKTKPALS